jgi:hypothetical protein
MGSAFGTLLVKEFKRPLASELGKKNLPTSVSRDRKLCHNSRLR